MVTYESTKKEYVSKYGEISSGFFEDKKSKFFCFVFKVTLENEALNYISKIKNEFKDARHVVYLYSLQSQCVKFSDDGEPQGTGTRAIYDILQREEITNLCIVIVRYFGGVLLGAGPLARAYLNSFRDAVATLNKVEVIQYDILDIKLPYNMLETFENDISRYKENKRIIVLDINYDVIVTINLKIDNNLKEEMLKKYK